MITTRERVRFGHKPLPHFVRSTERLGKLGPDGSANTKVKVKDSLTSKPGGTKTATPENNGAADAAGRLYES
jgi:hypothetical protein